jgi:hypothetical protein
MEMLEIHSVVFPEATYLKLETPGPFERHHKGFLECSSLVPMLSNFSSVNNQYFYSFFSICPVTMESMLRSNILLTSIEVMCSI